MDPYVGEVRLTGFNWAPVGWLLCNGQLVSISLYDTLYSLLGTTYGGDGQTTFGLPDLRGRTPIHAGQGQGLSQRTLGEVLGSEAVALTGATMPQHIHTVSATTVTAGAVDDPTGAYWAPSSTSSKIYSDGNPNGGMSGNCLDTTGISLPHENMMPFVVVNFIIAYAGVYPSRP